MGELATKSISKDAEENNVAASDCADAVSSSNQHVCDSQLQDLSSLHGEDRLKQTWETISQNVVNLLENKEVEGSGELVELSKKVISLLVDFCTSSAESSN